VVGRNLDLEADAIVSELFDLGLHDAAHCASLLQGWVSRPPNGASENGLDRPMTRQDTASRPRSWVLIAAVRVRAARGRDTSRNTPLYPVRTRVWRNW
jgi:hypothetical protein